MKKIVSGILCFALCILFVAPVSAAEISNGSVGNVVRIEGGAVAPRATDYFSGSTVRMNSFYGSQSTISKISSGSVLGVKHQVTSVSLSVTVSSGSAPFKLYVEDPFGHSVFTTVNRSGTVEFTNFNGLDPQGTWKVYIVTNGTVSTATARMTVRYSY